MAIHFPEYNKTGPTEHWERGRLARQPDAAQDSAGETPALPVDRTECYTLTSQCLLIFRRKGIGRFFY
jgi:hypothetical protein